MITAQVHFLLVKPVQSLYNNDKTGLYERTEDPGPPFPGIRRQKTESADYEKTDEKNISYRGTDGPGG